MSSDAPTIPLAIPVVGEAEARYLRECIDTNFVSSVGPFTTRFEAMVAAATGAEHGVATSSGTTGLHAALLTAGVGRDDLVIVPSFTFIASVNAVAHCGATPWLMEVDPDTWLVDLAAVERELERHTIRHRDGRLLHRPTGRRVAAFMPVYTLGTLTDPDAQRALAARYNLPVVADAAAALGATFHGRPIADGADLSVISFNGNKTVTAGGGGMIVGRDEALMKAARHLTTTARSSADYTFDQVGYNYRITNLQAAVGCAQMERLDEFVAAKRRIRRWYAEALGDLPGISLFPGTGQEGSGCWFSGIVLGDDRLPAAADLSTRLREAGVEARTFWKPAHLQPAFTWAPRAELPVTERLWSRILTLPCSTNLTEGEAGRVVAALRRLIG